MDEIVLSVTAFAGAIFAAGLAFGGLIAYLLLPGERRARRLEAELEQVRKETTEYKSRVSRHFHRTAELVSGLTNSYKAVYDHLAGGAQELAEVPDGSRALAFADPKLLVEQTAPASAPADPADGTVPDSAQSPSAEPSAGAGDSPATDDLPATDDSPATEEAARSDGVKAA